MGLARWTEPHFKHDVTPRVVEKKTKAKAEFIEWRRTCKAVDDRDKKRCQVTGVALSAGAVDGWLALERHHLEARSRARSRRYNAHNVWTISRAVHQLCHAGALLIFDKRGKPATDVRKIDHVAWNRRVIAKGDEPCKLRKGLAVRELAA